MSPLGFGIAHCRRRTTFHHRQQPQISLRRYAIVRPKRTDQVSLGRRRKQTIKAMRAVVQRVASASVEVEGRTVSAIGPGLLVLIGLHETDVDSDAEYICRKVLNMRLFPNDNNGKTWDQSVVQRNYEVLLVSQFTLFGILKGNKPDFHVAMPPDVAKPFYASVVEKFQKAYRVDAVKDGVFGAMMKVNLVNDGPVTMQLDSRQLSKNSNGEAKGS
ncbi:D-Tyr-tRNA(Tyr) deacylase family protein [Striga hermonthica]|uniref:D-aminoacyl-tRNA deacylase n=1 Tax=Striga hermonthica TaxID=68872 RepID=A0A9N7MY39_STRHE|nr:D-Tyr-tRNA(Tyr) deacylase family protein [Striga hermonthica]